MMTTRTHTLRALLTGVIVLTTLLGCSRTPPTRFFILMPADGIESTAVGALAGSTVGVGPVSVAAYLDRPQVVSRKTRSELNVAEFVQWAEPLAPNIGRVLVENLSDHMAGASFLLLPLRGLPKLDYEIRIRVLRLDSGPDESARLEAEWAIVKEDKIVTQDRRSFQIAAGTETGAVVDAQGALLADLARALAQSLMMAHGKS